MKFEWDEEKNQKNIRKHGIAFEDAILVFEDELRLELYDEAHSSEEERWNIIGWVDKVLFVVCTERGDTTRIISARIASRREEELYYGNGYL